MSITFYSFIFSWYFLYFTFDYPVCDTDAYTAGITHIYLWHCCLNVIFIVHIPRCKLDEGTAKQLHICLLTLQEVGVFYAACMYKYL